MNEEQRFITSYVINPGKQTFNGLTFVHKHTVNNIHIHIVNQCKADPTIHIQCYDLECQNNPPNHVLQPIL